MDKVFGVGLASSGVTTIIRNKKTVIHRESFCITVSKQRTEKAKALKGTKMQSDGQLNVRPFLVELETLQSLV